MEEYSCLDVYGNPITEFVFNDDGTVSGVATQSSGVYEQPESSFGKSVYSSSKLVQLSRECCEKFGFTYNTTTRECYYKKPCADVSNPDNLQTGESIQILDRKITDIKKQLDSLSTEDPTYPKLNAELLELIDLNYSYLTQLKPNNVKLIFGADGSNPVLYEVENATGDLSLEQEEQCDEEIAELIQTIKKTTDKLNYYNSTVTAILTNIDKTNQLISDLTSENASLDLVLTDANSTQNYELATTTQAEIDSNTAQIEQYNQDLVNFNNQLSAVEHVIAILTEYVTQLQEQLAGLQEVCDPTPPPCNLNIEFDYLWNFDCEELLNCAVGDDSMSNYLNTKYNECLEQVTILQEQIDRLNNQITDIVDGIAEYQQQLVDLEAQLEGNTNPVDIYLIQSDIDNILMMLETGGNMYIDLITQINALQGQLDLQNAVCEQIQNQIDNYQTYGNLIQALQGVKFYLTVEKWVLNTTTNQYEWETVYREEFFRIDNLLEHIKNNPQTGIYLTGDRCDELINNISIQLGENCDAISANTFYSQWLHQSTTIDASVTYNGNNVINEIVNEYITFGIEIEYDNANCEYCILIDRIEMNQNCEKTDKTELLVNRCPNFEMRRVVDNKKSWMNITSGHTREFDLTDRETYYKTLHHKAVVNSKEIDLEVDPAHAMELDVFSYNSVYPCILSGTTGQTNYLNFISTDINDISNVNEFIYTLNSELIDVKSRKVISGYPALRAIYDRYLSSSDFCPSGSTPSNAYTYCDLINFSKLLGTFWIDLIEQVVPSTTIWGSVYRYSNTLFDTNKFRYKKYTTKYCVASRNECDDNFGQTTVPDVIIEDLSNENDAIYPECFIASNTTTNCGLLMTQDYSDSCEYRGNVVIINPVGDGTGDGGDDTGDGGDNIITGDGVIAQEDVDYNLSH